MNYFRGGARTGNAKHRSGLGKSFRGLVRYLEQGSEREVAGAVRAASVVPLADYGREVAGDVFARAESWGDLDEGLAAVGLRVEPTAGGGAVLSDGERTVKLSAVGRALSGPKLAARFGVSLSEHRGEHPAPELEPRVPAPGRERMLWWSTRGLPVATSPQMAAGLMTATAARRAATVAKPVYHFGLTLPAGESLSRAQWEGAVDRVLSVLGLGPKRAPDGSRDPGYQALVVAHGDTSHEHVHVVVNRVHLTGPTWRTWQDVRTLERVTLELARELGIEVTRGEAGDRVDLGTGEVQAARQLGRPPLVEHVRSVAGRDFAEASSWLDLEKRLAEHGLRLEPTRNGRGVVVSDGSRRVKLSAVGRELSGPKLAARYGIPLSEHRETHAAPPLTPPSGVDLSEVEGQSLEDRASFVLRRLTAHEATFTAKAIYRATFWQPDAEKLREVIYTSEDLLELEPGRFTTSSYLAAEDQLFAASEKLSKREWFAVPSEDVETVLELGVVRFGEDQREAVHHAVSGSDLAIVIGRAGSGKTTLARAIKEIYTEADCDVLGGALTGKAAEGLQRETGISSRTLASWEYAWARDRDHLRPGDVLVIDEAGLVDVRQLGRVLEYAERVEAKVVLLGDPEQLRPIGAGHALRGLVREHGAVTVETVRRQREGWQREASEDLAQGRVGEALEAYRDHGSVSWWASRQEAREALASVYLEEARPDGSAIVLAYRRVDVAALNESIRASRKERGELGHDVELAGVPYAVGDRFVFLENDNWGNHVKNLDPEASGVGVKNGTLGTIEALSERRIVVRLDQDGRQVAFDPEAYESFAHGYALTIHKSQGVTVDRAYVLADRIMDRSVAYVALTRHRDQVELFVDGETFEDHEDLVRALGRERAKDLARDYPEALERIRGPEADEQVAVARMARQDAVVPVPGMTPPPVEHPPLVQPTAEQAPPRPLVEQLPPAQVPVARSLSPSEMLQRELSELIHEWRQDEARRRAKEVNELAPIRTEHGELQKQIVEHQRWWEMEHDSAKRRVRRLVSDVYRSPEAVIQSIEETVEDVRRRYGRSSEHPQGHDAIWRDVAPRLSAIFVAQRYAGGTEPRKVGGISIPFTEVDDDYRRLAKHQVEPLSDALFEWVKTIASEPWRPTQERFEDAQKRLAEIRDDIASIKKRQLARQARIEKVLDQIPERVATQLRAFLPRPVQAWLLRVRERGQDLGLSQ